MNLRSSSKETFMIVYGSEVFHRGSFTVRDLFSSSTFLSYTFMHSRGPRKQLRDSRKKTDHCSSSLPFSTFLRDATFIPCGSRFVFRSYDSPGTHCVSCGYLMGHIEAVRREDSVLQLQHKKVRHLTQCTIQLSRRY